MDNQDRPVPSLTDLVLRDIWGNTTEDERNRLCGEWSLEEWRSVVVRVRGQAQRRWHGVIAAHERHKRQKPSHSQEWYLDRKASTREGLGKVEEFLACCDAKLMELKAAFAERGRLRQQQQEQKPTTSHRAHAEENLYQQRGGYEIGWRHATRAMRSLVVEQGLSVETACLHMLAYAEDLRGWRDRLIATEPKPPLPDFTRGGDTI